MKYIVTEKFNDSALGKVFAKGAEYPAQEAGEERVQSLLTGNNRCGRPFIRVEPDADDAERESLLTEAKDLGLTIHPNTGIAKIKEKIAEAKAEG